MKTVQNSPAKRRLSNRNTPSFEISRLKNWRRKDDCSGALWKKEEIYSGEKKGSFTILHDCPIEIDARPWRDSPAWPRASRMPGQFRWIVSRRSPSSPGRDADPDATPERVCDTDLWYPAGLSPIWAPEPVEKHKTMNTLSINQSINQSIEQSIIRTINQSINQPHRLTSSARDSPWGSMDCSNSSNTFCHPWWCPYSYSCVIVFFSSSQALLCRKLSTPSRNVVVVPSGDVNFALNHKKEPHKLR